MELKLSKNGLPFIEFDKDNRVILSNVGKKTNGGHKWLTWKLSATESIAISGGKKGKGKKKSVEVSSVVTFTTDTKLTGIPREAKASPFLSKENLEDLKKAFKGHSDENGIIKSDQIEALAITIGIINESM